MKSWGVVQADAAWDNHDISITTVSFNNRDDLPSRRAQSAYLQSLVRGKGQFYETSEADDLPRLLRDISDQMTVVLVE